jgi:hypothetical protein
VSLKNKTFKIGDVLALAQHELESDEIKKLWKSCVEHVIKLEKLISEKEAIFEEIMDHRVIIIPNDSDSEIDSSGGSDSESCDSLSHDESDVSMDVN